MCEKIKKFTVLHSWKTLLSSNNIWIINNRETNLDATTGSFQVLHIFFCVSNLVAKAPGLHLGKNLNNLLSNHVALN